MAQRKRSIWAWPLVASGAAALLLGTLVVATALMKARVLRAPYPDAGKRIAWMLGCGEQAYNLDTVVQGRLYRSGRPDERLIRLLHEKYGLRRVVSLNGKSDFQRVARELGMEVTVFWWSSSAAPPPEELDRVLKLMDSPGPVLVHCSAGSDRTGYAVAAYRVRYQGWSVADAIKEMNRYWHNATRKPQLQESLRRMAAESASRPASSPRD